jgi:uncharacterized membrane protein YbhN (UPF0104 family)
MDGDAAHRRSLGTLRLAGFYLAGFAADNLLFGQAGIGLRVFLLQREGISIATAIGSQVLDKILEGAGLLVLACVALYGTPGQPVLTALRASCVAHRSLAHLLPLLGLLLAGFLVILFRAGGSQGRLQRFLSNARVALNRALVAARPLRSPGTAAEVAVLTFLCWGAELLMLYWLVLCLRSTLSARQGVLVLVLSAIALLVPGLPANIGPFEAAVTMGLGAAGLPAEQALPAALLYHLIHTVPVTIGGLPGLKKALTSFRRQSASPSPSGERPDKTTGSPGNGSR